MYKIEGDYGLTKRNDMDKISIRNLEVFGNHGVFPEETRLGQKFVIDADLYLDIRAAGTSDNLLESVNYGEVSHFVAKFLTQNTYKLIEAAAEQSASALLREYDRVRFVRLAIHKPWAPIGLPLEDVAVEIIRGWHEVYISFGSNMGDREQYIKQGIEQLQMLEDCKVIKISQYMETEPYGVTEQDKFLNGCLKLQTLLTPQELLTELHKVEEQAGRKRTLRWGPRTLDLDIIFYDDCVIAQEDLMIPHVDMQHRLFVLEPLCEIAPYAFHPVLHKSVMQLKEEACDVQDLKILK